MKIENKTKKRISRRDFIKTTAAGVGGAALTGLSPGEARAAGRPEKWDRETDVVVVGCGGAGTTAAITAYDAGAEVIIVEKAPEGGGNSRLGGAQFTYSTPELKDQAVRYLYKQCNGATPVDVCQAWVDEMVHNQDWLTSMGLENMVRPPSDDSLGPLGAAGASFKQMEGAKGLGQASVKGGGIGWYPVIEKQIRDRGIDIMFNTPATELVQDYPTREILGVKVQSGGKDLLIKARKGVVLCSGGFEFNEDMKRNYLRPGTIKFTGWIYNTGDGIRMAQAVGADLWHMNLIASASATILTPPLKMGWVYPFPQADGYIFVTKYGERFAPEGRRMFDSHRSFMGMSLWDWRTDRKDTEYPLCPHYLIFDEVTRKAGSIGGFPMAGPVTPKRLGGNASEWGAKDGAWSEDNSVEIEKGWILKADTIKALAKAMAEPEMPPETLVATVDRWNEFCEAGEDKDFRRDEKTLVKIATPPYYAVRQWPGGFSTCGGPRRNAKGQVLGVDGKPLGRLYAAGSLGHTLGHVYGLAGANYCECFVFGRISGRNAAALKSWG